MRSNWKPLLLASVTALSASAQQPSGQAPPSDDATREKSSTLNNGANRAALAPPGEDAQLAQVPGGKATPKSEWKKGDKRGLKHSATQRKGARAREAAAKVKAP